MAKEGTNTNHSYSLFEIEFWPPVKTRGCYCRILESVEFQKTDFIKAVNLDQNIIAYNHDSDAFSVEEKGEVKPDALPWSNTSNSTTDICLPPQPCNTECWHENPVEVAARRYERAGRFQDASKLRVDFRGLNILHRRILQWYRWAESQWTLKGSSWFPSYEYYSSSYRSQNFPERRHWTQPLLP